uniref:Uncharacterized protein n=1 Tax=Moorena producens (strain JHB) TaxID=1454205 RepID=A0A1D9FTP6_MOOP1
MGCGVWGVADKKAMQRLHEGVSPTRALDLDNISPTRALDLDNKSTYSPLCKKPTPVRTTKLLWMLK